MDAIPSLKLYQAAELKLVDKEAEIEGDIPEGWYTFNSKLGESMKTKDAVDNSEVA